jgi:hypothetical protein
MYTPIKYASLSVKANGGEDGARTPREIGEVEGEE